MADTNPIAIVPPLWTPALKGVYETEIGNVGADEVITRQQALLALTKNVAYMWHQENNLGSLASGKITNLTVLDTDLLNDEIGKLVTAKVVATVVNGDIVYKA